jgi:hypothetical protein
MMGLDSSESSGEHCLLEVSTIPYFSLMFDKVVDEHCFFSVILIGQELCFTGRVVSDVPAQAWPES